MHRFAVTILLCTAFFISAAGQETGNKLPIPPLLTPVAGLRQWNSTGIELGISTGILTGATGMRNFNQTTHAHYFSFTASTFIQHPHTFGLELGYWYLIGAHTFSKPVSCTVGMHLIRYNEYSSRVLGFSLPEPGIRMRVPHTRHLVVQAAYRYQFLFGQYHPPGLTSNLVSLWFCRDQNMDWRRVYR